MTARKLDAALVQERLQEIQLLLADLVEVGEVNAERLRRERPTRRLRSQTTTRDQGVDC